ncbi:hypothetical protein D3C72_1870280 [compost metagenome]
MRHGWQERIRPAAHHQGDQFLAVGRVLIQRLLGHARVARHRFHGRGRIAFVQQQPGGRLHGRLARFLGWPRWTAPSTDSLALFFLHAGSKLDRWAILH